jgi:hypothetical protein
LEAYKHLRQFVLNGSSTIEGIHILSKCEFIEYNGTTWELTNLGHTIANKKGWKVSRWNCIATALFGQAMHSVD